MEDSARLAAGVLGLDRALGALAAAVAERWGTGVALGRGAGVGAELARSAGVGTVGDLAAGAATLLGRAALKPNCCVPLAN